MSDTNTNATAIMASDLDVSNNNNDVPAKVSKTSKDRAVPDRVEMMCPLVLGAVGEMMADSEVPDPLEHHDYNDVLARALKREGRDLLTQGAPKRPKTYKCKSDVPKVVMDKLIEQDMIEVHYEHYDKVSAQTGNAYHFAHPYVRLTRKSLNLSFDLLSDHYKDFEE